MTFVQLHHTCLCRVNPKKTGNIQRKLSSLLVEDPELKEFAKAVSVLIGY